MTYGKIQDGRCTPYWKLKKHHNRATITDISTEIGGAPVEIEFGAL